jgi:cytochrome b561
MSWKNTANRYGSLPIALHWLMLLLLIGVYTCTELRTLYPKGSDLRETLKAWHYTQGLLVFILVWLRLAARFAAPAPGIHPAPPAWQQWASKLLHLALYALMIVMPLLGWLAVSAAGKHVPFFGLELPPLMAPDKALAKTIEDVHETIGNAGYFLIGLHAAAALYHHYVVRDDTLLRMLPARK